jgi:hypothetical protein
MGHIVGTTIFAMSYQYNSSSHRNKTGVYGVQVIHYDIGPKNLNNMEQGFHLQICKC